uniref:Uncharacterized protein n=1 Tax=Romanomermis culicivorax TaxID=13658 RepID=A0A915IZH5_ROMCU
MQTTFHEFFAEDQIHLKYILIMLHYHRIYWESFRIGHTTLIRLMGTNGVFGPLVLQIDLKQ